MAPPATGVRTLIANLAGIITVDEQLGDLRRADILIDGDVISAVGSSLPVDPGSAEIIDGTNLLALPGFVDTHRHTWESQLHGTAVDWTHRQYYAGTRGAVGHRYRPEDMYAGILLGLCESLDSGITTTLDWNHNLNSPAHADASYEALRDSGSRAVFGYGGSNDQWLPITATPLSTDSRRIRERYFASDDDLLTMCLALRGPDLSTEEAVVHDWNLARDLGLRVSVHVGGTDFMLLEHGKRARGGAVSKLRSMDLLDPMTTYIHCNRCTDDELKLVAETGGTFSISPEVEMQMEMGFPITGRLMRMGLRPSLSVDVPNALPGSMFGLMRATLQVERAFANEAAIDKLELPDRVELRARDVVRFATLEGARANQLDHKVGSITPGKQADVILLRTDDLAMTPLNNLAGQVAMGGHPGLVDTVFVAGRCVKRGGTLVHVDVDRVRRLAIESRDWLFAQAGIDLSADWIPDLYHGKNTDTAAVTQP